MLLWLLGCPAEMLGIPVPKSGPDAIAMDDLVRDVAKLSEGSSASAEDQRLAFLEERWRQMRLVPEAGGRCGRQPGADPAAVAIVAEAWKPGEVASFAPAAVAISVAKAFDGQPLGLLFCVGDAPPAAKIVRISAIGTGPTRLRSGTALVGATVDPAVDGVVLDGIGTEDLDYRRLEAGARLLVPAVTALAGI